MSYGHKEFSASKIFRFLETKTIFFLLFSSMRSFLEDYFYVYILFFPGDACGSSRRHADGYVSKMQRDAWIPIRDTDIKNKDPFFFIFSSVIKGRDLDATGMVHSAEQCKRHNENRILAPSRLHKNVAEARNKKAFSGFNKPIRLVIPLGCCAVSRQIVEQKKRKY